MSELETLQAEATAARNRAAEPCCNESQTKHGSTGSTGFNMGS